MFSDIMTLSQLHRSQHTLCGISQHSRHVTWETGSKGFPATGLKRNTKKQERKSAEQRRKYPDKNMAQVCQVWRVNLKWICVHWNGPGRHDSTFHSRLHFCLKEYVFCFQISRWQKKATFGFQGNITLCCFLCPFVEPAAVNALKCFWP